MSEPGLGLELGPELETEGLVDCGRSRPGGAPNPPVYFPVLLAGGATVSAA